MKLTARLQREHENPDRPCVGLWFHNPVATPDAIITLSSLYNPRTRKRMADALVASLDDLVIDEINTKEEARAVRDRLISEAKAPS
jgi:hypothetical protein